MSFWSVGVTLIFITSLCFVMHSRVMGSFSTDHKVNWQTLPASACIQLSSIVIGWKHSQQACVLTLAMNGKEACTELVWKWEFADTPQGWSLWMLIGKTSKGLGHRTRSEDMTRMTSAICHLFPMHMAPSWPFCELPEQSQILNRYRLF